MSDDELQVVAGDGWELTDGAQQALQGEISRRGLKVKLKVAPPPSPAPEPGDAAGRFDPADLELVVVQGVWDLSEARRVRETLDAVGIPSYFGTNNAEEMDELGPGFEGGVDVKVGRLTSNAQGKRWSPPSRPLPRMNRTTLHDARSVIPPKLCFRAWTVNQRKTPLRPRSSTGAATPAATPGRTMGWSRKRE